MTPRHGLRLLTTAASLSALLVGAAVGVAADSGPEVQLGPAWRAVTVLSYGAVGDGRTDDTEALQRALDTVPVGTDLVLPAGRTFVHSDVLRIRRAGTVLSGSGTLLASVESRSSLWIEADNVTVDGPTLTITGTSRRWDAWEQMRLRVKGVQGTVLRQVTVDGSAAAGIYVGNGASRFLLDRVTVKNTRADGIHLTGGAHTGQLVSPTVINSGDDGVAVVSYRQDGSPSHHITVSSPRVLGTNWGRGLTVVGGEDITFTDVHVERSSAAAVYLAAEGAPWHTHAPRRVRVTGGTLVDSNHNRGVDHGALLVLAGTDHRPEDLVVSGLRISGTRSTATRSVGIITYGTPPTGVRLQDLTVVGGPRAAYQGNTPSGYSLLRWTQDGIVLPDQLH